PHAHRTRAPHLSNDTLPAVEHPLAESLTNRVHLFARIPRLVDKQYRVPNLDFAPNHSHKVDSRCLDIRSHHTGGNGFHTHGYRVLSNLFPFHQRDLASRRFPGMPAEPSEVSRIPFDSLCGNELCLISLLQRGTRRHGVKM